MRFHADLHVHSKYSRATSRDLDLENLSSWACRKGIQVVATGDFTHPAWLAELKHKLVPAEPGLFRLESGIERDVANTLPAVCRASTRFMLSVEISTIYKKGDKTRKVHHLLYAPHFDAVDRIVTRLAKIGNITSDGRPILGLDSRNLLEIVLESDPASYLVPAHIWTPWFSAMGSKSGFDSIEECYGDLADHIFAVETGLSSDPAMNWRLSILDKYRLTSNSDAHSPGKLGREATVFDTDVDYYAIRNALKTGAGYEGTVEFFPEEGKYHLDGHRACNIRFTPQETLEHSERCPVCGFPVTVGVLHRIETLADRNEADVVPPATAGKVSSLVPLPEILSELAGAGPASKTVGRSYDQLIGTLGPELDILNTIPIEDIARGSSSLFAEAITRLRAGQVIRESGYDGEYGVIHLFEDTELQQRKSGGVLFDLPALSLPSKKRAASAEKLSKSASQKKKNETTLSPPVEFAVTSEAAVGQGLDDEQQTAVETAEGSLIILAGPGSGKTRTLTYRIANLVTERGVSASSCLAITFTRRAAEEMKERLSSLLWMSTENVTIHTFHSLGLMILREHPEAAGLSEGFRIADETERAALLSERLNLTERRATSLLHAISKVKRTRTGYTYACASPDTEITDDPKRAVGPELTEAIRTYETAMRDSQWIDFDDLVGLAVRVLQDDETLATLYRARFQWISVDEFQDVDDQQYRLLRLLAPSGANICVIGDPNQAIYGFRGADAACFDRFVRDYADTRIITLRHNYRSSGTIVAAASQVIASRKQPELPQDTIPMFADTSAVPDVTGVTPVVTRAMMEQITIHAAPTEQAEAEFVVHNIERLIGGHSFFSFDSGRTTDTGPTNLSFADFAVLYRTDAQSQALIEALDRSGIPFRKHGHDLLSDRPDVHLILKEFGIESPAYASDDLPQSLNAQLTLAAGRVMANDPELDPVAIHTALYQLKAIAETCGDDRNRFAETIMTATEADTWDPRADRVSLLTLHASKGLEFPVVFITGVEDGIVPLLWGKTGPEAATPTLAAAIEEERRLFYVGMTRAQDQLVLTRAAQRYWRGRIQEMDASPFLNDIESALVEYERRKAPRPKEKDAQLTLL